ncbi:acriflavin resistance protein [Thermaerobacter marianensis DSM 12885]|uniref:Acriflavin resistance protein n=1 Tax=Thermaerobacter marianensis (strain ATCC 700841 / DSM 12885 / JCM 10246 / 7p75a) TaxID=644966 RepID=E6SLX4_THEM7|nr:efflux RND transporter permease subunit [Thermaerobacter marianensis]ADU51423.1 acriflavin resistance protein [Thermaerobacter marianensis DSM 12885]
MSIARFSVHRPVFVTVLVIALVLLGAFLLPAMPVDLLPQLELPVVVVATSYPGASPAELEARVVEPLEQAVSTINGVKGVRSIAQTGSALVILELDWGTDLDFTVLEVQKRIDAVRGILPEDAGSPRVLTLDPSATPVVTVGLTGDLPAGQLQSLAEDRIAPALEQVDGVASVGVVGLRQREVRVVLDPARLEAYGLSPALVARALGGGAGLVTAGSVNRGRAELSVRLDAQYTSARDVAQAVIPTPTGAAVRVADVATVEEALADPTQLAYLDGKPVVQLQVLKATDGNTLAVSRGVERALARLRPQLPPGVELRTILDQGDFIEESVRTVAEHGLLGGAIAVAVLYLFLGNWRTTLVVGLMLPVSVIGSFAMLAAAGQTLNIVSLGGLLIGIGSLVDFAIVVIESIHRYRMRGTPPLEGAEQGTAEVAAAVTASAIAQGAVFFPMMLTGGLAAELFTPLALAVIFSHAAALFGAVTFVPMLAARVLGTHYEAAGLLAGFHRLIERLEAVYRRLLAASLRRRGVVMAVAVVALAASLVLAPRLGSEFLPQADSGEIQVTVRTPPGTRLEETAAVARQVEETLMKVPEVDRVVTTVGAAGGGFSPATASANEATVVAVLVPVQQRARSVFDVLASVEAELDTVPGAEIQATVQSSVMGAGLSQLEVRVTGDDPETLARLADQVVERARQLPGVAAAASSLRATRPEVVVRPDRDALARSGLSVQELEVALRSALGGMTVARVRTGTDQWDVRMMLPATWKDRYGSLADLPLRSAVGQAVRLGDVARVTVERASLAITRQDGRRQVQVAVHLDGSRPLGQVSADLSRQLESMDWPAGTTWALAGEAEQMNETFRSLGLSIVLAILLVYLIMAAQFESFFHPLVILFCLPPTVVGAVAGLAVHRVPIGVTALLGFLMLVGVVMNNAIVLVDYTNVLRRRGVPRDQALLQAGPVRLRPILMTMLTTNLGLVPFAYLSGASSELLRPLAVVVIYGLLVSTLVTLVLVPVAYSLLDDGLRRLGTFVRRGAGREAAVSEAGLAETGR